MMRAIVGWSLRFRLLVLGLAAASLLFGFVQLPHVPVDVVPEFTPPFVEVQTEALGLSAEEVEQLITVPLEADLLNGVAWLDSIQSESVAGLSSIVLLFDPGTDVIRARQMVAERLTQAHALPNVSKAPIMLQPLSSTSRVMMVGLSSDELSLIDMSVLARWTIRPRLMGVAGVANVAIWGQRERQLQVQVDPERLRAAGVSLLQVVETTGNALWFSPLTFLNASTPGTGGFIDTPNQRLSVQHISPITTAAELARVPIEPDDPLEPGTEGSGLTLGDVANVVEDHQPLIGDAVVNDRPGLLLVIEKFPEANTLEVTRSIDEAIEALRPGLLGVEIDATIFRPATFIETAIGNLAIALIIAFALMALTLGTLLFSWRALVICLVAIPLSLAAGGLVLYLMGATINAIVVAGFALAVGVIVDDSVIGVDSIVRRLRVPLPEDQGKPMASVILEATVEGRSAIAYATLIILLAVLPVVFIGGAAGAFLPPLVISFALAVLTSTLVALSVSVALGLILLPQAPVARRESPLLRWLQSRYQAALSRVINRPRPAFLTAGAVTIGVIALVAISMTPQLGQSVLPTFKDRDLLIHWDGPPGTSLTEMNRVVTQASQELRAIDGVRNVGAHIGRAVTSDQVVSINSGELWISVDPGADYRTTLASIQEVVAGYPSVTREISTYEGERINQVLAAPQHDIVVRVYGKELEALRGKADEVAQLISGIDGVAGASAEAVIEEPSLRIEVDLEAAAEFGVKPGEVRRAAATLLSGIEVGNLFEEQKVFEVVVWGVPELRTGVDSVRELLIDNASGNLVRLGDVADVRIALTPSVINHDRVHRFIDVTASLAGRDLDSVLADVRSGLQTLEFPLEYRAEVLADSSERQAELYRVLGLVAAAAAGVFLLLQAAFGSWRLAGLALLTLPIALVGGALASFATGGLSLGSVAGFLAVLGIAARNGIMLIAHYRSLELETGEVRSPSLILRGARERLGPIVTTALATALALVPFVVLGDLPGYEILGPMAVVILGGLVTATLLTLFLLPTAYLHSGPSAEAEKAAIEVGVSQPSEPQAVGAN